MRQRGPWAGMKHGYRATRRGLSPQQLGVGDRGKAWRQTSAGAGGGVVHALGQEQDAWAGHEYATSLFWRTRAVHAARAEGTTRVRLHAVAHARTPSSAQPARPHPRQVPGPAPGITSRALFPVAVPPLNGKCLSQSCPTTDVRLTDASLVIQYWNFSWQRVMRELWLRRLLHVGCKRCVCCLTHVCPGNRYLQSPSSNSHNAASMSLTARQSLGFRRSMVIERGEE